MARSRRHKKAEFIVAAIYGVYAPFPNAAAQDRYIKWKNADARDPARLKVPKPYKSWMHLGSFMEALERVDAGG